MKITFFTEGSRYELPNHITREEFHPKITVYEKILRLLQESDTE